MYCFDTETRSSLCPHLSLFVFLWMGNGYFCSCAGVFKDFDSWDSLTLLTLIATVDSEFGFTMSASDLNELDTIKDLVTFIENKKA